MLRMRKLIIDGEIFVVSMSDTSCNWSRMATMEETLDMVCEGGEIKTGSWSECLDGFLFAEEDGNIIEVKRQASEAITVDRMEILYSFGLNDNSYGVLTGSQIDEMCIEANTTIYKKTIAAYDDAEWMVCCVGSIDDGSYIVSDGILEVKNGELEHITLRVIA